MINLRLLAAGCALLFCTGCQSLLGLDPSESDCKHHYTYEQVGEWDRMFNGGTRIPGMVSYHFDAKKVCLAVGVVKWSVVPAVEAKLRSLNIPRDAVYIRIEQPGQLASVAATRLARLIGNSNSIAG